MASKAQYWGMKVLHAASMMSVAVVCGQLQDTYGFVGIFLANLLQEVLIILYCTFLPRLRKNRLHEINSSEENPMLPQIIKFLQALLVESIFVHRIVVGRHFLTDRGSSNPFMLQYLFFVPKSFVFEITHDFFHYWIHRCCHMNKFLYRYIHAEHHHHDKPGPLSTFNNSVLEHVLSILLPCYLAFCVCHLRFRFTSYQFQLLFIYRHAVEVGGHSGMRGDDWYGFNQFPFLTPISILPRDHDRHHSHRVVNFSKSLKIWDLVFGTYYGKAR